jgi:hypothetical protein
MTATGTDDFEQRLREVMRSGDSLPAGFTAGQVVVGGRRRRRARAAAMSGVAFVAVAGLAMSATTVVLGGRGQGGYQPAVSPMATSATSARSSAPEPSPSKTKAPSVPTGTVREVSPGNIDIGGGYTLALTAASVTLVSADGSVGPNSTGTGNQGFETVNLMVSDRAVASIYIGAHDVASATVTLDGVAYPATVLKLTGHPGWCVAYVVLPPGSVGAAAVVTVYDATGRQLATSLPPSSTGQR